MIRRKPNLSALVALRNSLASRARTFRDDAERYEAKGWHHVALTFRNRAAELQEHAFSLSVDLRNIALNTKGAR